MDTLRGQLLSMLSENAGALSATRYVYVFSSCLTVFFVVAVWACVSITNGAMSDIPSGVLYFVGAVLSILSGAKVMQKGQEKKPCDPATVVPEGDK